ncbi:adenylate/guanylate cyclase domain-containing protein [Pantanalinema sp. GBBB05]|uniref:adenylate/guanylate cyclase domain-containing protein n=1 Tax=Pantanalinema sp. GBBB05 TaxID=2604139 RepID=UPI001DBF451E|nr:adenylate/guanylate cyclase domain-containing protein [Pantanalinema sp. GBBB05]
MTVVYEATKPTWYHSPGRRLALVIGAPAIAQLLGSAFNIWYNSVYVQPLLTPGQLSVFWLTVIGFNAIIYPMGMGLWIWSVLALKGPLTQVSRQQAIAPERLLRARQRTINLPWWGITIAGSLWFLCIPVFLLTLVLAPGSLNPQLFWDLPISFTLSALIATTHSFFAIELLVQKLLYPVLFQDVQPYRIPGTFPLSLRWRGLVLAFCGSICPISSLLLLMLAPHACTLKDTWFAITVGSLGIIFSLTSTWMVGQLVVEPIRELQRVAMAVASENLQIRINSLHADEFGSLIEEVNHMIDELQEKQVLQETFGRHVGERAAVHILQRDPSLGGIEQELTVLFADLRNFTQRCATQPPQEIVTLLNLFLTEMVEIVEQRYGGMVNKFLGDGFMALFGVGDAANGHPTQATAAGLEMLHSLKTINQHLADQGQAPLEMGIGIHTGMAVVGSIGSSRRLEYTAIGDTVNVAARVESLTKEVGEPLLLTVQTQQALSTHFVTEPLPPQFVKGQPKALKVFRLVHPLPQSEVTGL